MNELKRILSLVTYQLFVNALLRSALLTAAVSLLMATFVGVPAVLLAGAISFAVGAFLNGLFQNKKVQAMHLIHQRVGDVEYSLPLLDKPQLNLAEQLQLERLSERVGQVRVPGLVWSRTGFYGVGLLAALGVYCGYPLLQTEPGSPARRGLMIALRAERKAVVPQFASAELRVQPPAYTGLAQTSSRDLNASAVVGSMLTWRVRFRDYRNLSVRLVNSRGGELAFRATSDGFTYGDRLLNSGLYSLRAYWRNPVLNRDSLVYQSDFYRLEAKPDLSPKIEPASKDLYRLHYLNDPKTLTIAARVSDDFRVTRAFIVATVARGSGENVKFREVRMPLGPANFSEARLTQTLDLNALQVAPGDELYYYWAAIDNRRPEPNFTKSDTYFVVYKDTTKLEAGELATMAVNIMPEYFRSQRQIIIDTEKLIAGRQRIADRTFKRSSNEIGFDQKALRLRYGQFLGEEFEKSIGGGDALPTDRDGDVVAGFAAMQQYIHKHDEGEGDHSPPAAAHSHEGHDHSHGGGGTDDKDPVAVLMEQYVHAHDDAETATFHEQSTRSLLKMALENMWQSELHLRLYEPEKALPFERKALEYLKLSQQKARSYVRKTGFDPPPIKESVRLTGELKNVTAAFQLDRTADRQRLGPLVAQVLGYLELPKLEARQRLTVGQLGSALANRVLNSGLRNWSVLTSLQKLAGGKPLSAAEKAQLKTHLHALTDASQPTTSSYTSDPTLERAFWQHLK